MTTKAYGFSTRYPVNKLRFIVTTWSFTSECYVPSIEICSCDCEREFVPGPIFEKVFS